MDVRSVVLAIHDAIGIRGESTPLGCLDFAHDTSQIRVLSNYKVFNELRGVNMA
jgi:hypothetical protein